MNKLKFIILICIPLFVISCAGKKGEGNFRELVTVPPEYVPSIKIPNMKAEKAIFINKDYSPGGKDWHLPTPEDCSKWDYQQYVKAMNIWAKPYLEKLTCPKCKSKLSENFQFLDRNKNDIRFKCKSRCGEEHIVTLQSG